MKIKNLLFLGIVLLCTMFCACAKKYEIGDIGPGGGIIFYIKGNKAYEVSEIIGETSWSKAKIMANDFRGGGYSDWYLPSKDELDLVYRNLRKKEIISGDSWHWSSSDDFDILAWMQRFSDGYDDCYYMNFVCSVRAIRSFNY